MEAPGATEPRIALVGHCGPDAYALRSALRSIIPGTDVSFVSDEEGLAAATGNAQLLLINRALDGRFPDADGVEMIRRLAATPAPRPALMLVSNIDDAQAAAAAAGALPGFGKRDLYSAQTRARIVAALARDRAPSA